MMLFLMDFLQMSEFVEEMEACLLDNIEEYIKEETIDEILEIVDNLKHEEPTKEDHCFSLSKQSERIQQVNVKNGASIKECEEDPLLISDDFIETSKVQYSCNQCAKSFSEKVSMQRHIKSEHEKVRFRCDKCDTSFSEKGTLQRHIKSAHMKIRYNCNKCEKCFSLKNNLKRHIKRVHEIPKEPQLEKEQ